MGAGHQDGEQGHQHGSRDLSMGAGAPGWGAEPSDSAGSYEDAGSKRCEFRQTNKRGSLAKVSSLAKAGRLL